MTVTGASPTRSRAALSSTAYPSSDLGRYNQTTSVEAESHARPGSTASSSPPELCSVDVRYDRRSPLTYDPISGRYLDAAATTNATTATNVRADDDDSLLRKASRFLHRAFVPEGVSPSYYRFMRWRILQRFANANVHVIGTQSLLMGLRGMQRAGGGVGGGGTAALGAAAATNWVLKDTLGKLVRMAWASKMGRKFDPDAKRWRYRASFIYALGNGLEVATYLHPRYFLGLAMLANSCKQMSMLTSSATRNALYNSFKVLDSDSAASGEEAGGGVARGASPSSPAVAGRAGGGGRGSGGSENIGDITAKGEAQIAFVDLLGIASGIYLSSE